MDTSDEPGTYRTAFLADHTSAGRVSGRAVRLGFRMWSSQTARDLMFLMAAAGFLFFVALGARDLWNPNEPIYGRAVVEMAERGDWKTPTVNGRVFAEKPILYFWSARVVSLLWGSISEFSLRVPSAVAGVVSVMLTYLLVLPYAGRGKALIAAALFATLHQVFWAARSVQMDILVLATTLAVVLPLTRMLDFGLRPSRAWSLAGIAAGLGFIAKGPVTWILPALIVICYAASRGRIHALWSRWIAFGACIAIAISAPWYVALWMGGDSAFLHEVLIRQNFSRFVNAWDHANPWWYYASYLLTDYAPWSLLLPAALMVRGRGAEERNLDRLSWIWIVSVVLFFSLADSKRAPYILPIAPAVAILAAGIVHRWTAQDLGRRVRIAASSGFILMISALIAGGAYLVFAGRAIPLQLRAAGFPFGIFLLISGSALLLLFALLQSNSKPVVVALFAVILTGYVCAAVWILPAANPIKSARGFSDSINRELSLHGGPVVSYRLWDWRAGYSFYSGRTIHNLKEPAALRRFWKRNENAFVLVEEAYRPELLEIIPDATLVSQQQIGGRRASLYSREARNGRLAHAARSFNDQRDHEERWR